MRKMIIGIATIFAASVAASTALANQSGERQGGPQKLFQRLDANQDGQISMDEVPDKAPERLKAMLKRADKDGDGMVSPKEIRQVAGQFRHEKHGKGPREDGPLGEGAGHGKRARKKPGASPSAAAHGRQGPDPRRGPRHVGPNRGSQRGPDPADLFDRMDRDSDGTLSLDEFTQGMRRVQAAFRHRGGGPGMGQFYHRGPMMWGQAGPGRQSGGHHGMGYMATMHPGMRYPGMRGPGRPFPPTWHERPGRSAMGEPGMGRPPMGPPAAAEKMRAGPAKKGKAIKKKAPKPKHPGDKKKRAQAARKKAQAEEALEIE